MYRKLHDLAAPMISPLTIQGMRGRMLVHPSRKSGAGRTILYVYGIHGSLERFYGVINFLARFGRVVTPDLPGFGGMETFYKVGKTPTMDAYGDYVAEFIKQELPEGNITLIGLSLGFVVITRMLVRHPELNDRVDLVISAMGLADGRDLNIKPPAMWAIRTLLLLGQVRSLANTIQFFATRKWMLRLMYSGNNPKMKALLPEERPGLIEFESYLWKCNDMQTYCVAMKQLFELRQPGAKVPLTVHHIETQNDHWLDTDAAEKHIGAVYQRLVLHDSKLIHHGGVAYAAESEAAEIIPPGVVALLDAV
jgi:pimeloyl-ACP methyl ester carboxylesterase